MGLFARLFGRSSATDQEADGWIEAPDLATALAGGQPPLVLDVRDADEFHGLLGHIDGAVNLPLGALAEQLGALAARGAPIVAVCKTDRRSAAAATMLRGAGAAKVRVLRGGMEQWRRAGLPTG